MNRVTINGVTYQGHGSVRISNNKVYIGGVEVTSKQQDQKQITIVVHGDVTSLEVDNCETITINGNVEGSISTQSADILCGNVGGNASTMSGDIKCVAIAGKASTMSGDIDKSIEKHRVTEPVTKGIEKREAAIRLHNETVKNVYDPNDLV